jgi:hypothetical protein
MLVETGSLVVDCLRADAKISVDMCISNAIKIYNALTIQPVYSVRL